MTDSTKSPAFQFYPDSWLSSADVSLMTPSEEGAYIRLLCHSWLQDDCGLPDDDDCLAVLSRLGRKWTKSAPKIRAKFQAEGGRLYNLRLVQERLKQRERRLKASEAGGNGATGKWGARPEHSATRHERLKQARAIGTHTAPQWEALVSATGRKCVRCGADGPIVKDHVIPIYQGGSDSIGNLQPLCKTCNCSKGAESKDWVPSSIRDGFSSGNPTRNARPLPDETSLAASGSSSSSSFLFSDKRINNTELEPEVRMDRWDLDETYTPLVELYRESGAPVIDEDFLAGHWIWRNLDFEQKALRINAFRHNLENGLYGDANFIPRPKKFIDQEWKRKLVPIKRKASVQDETARLFRERMARVAQERAQ